MSKANVVTLKDYLIHVGVPFDPREKKAELKARVKDYHENFAETVLQKYLSSTQALLFLPPYHSDELNAIEEVWGAAKMKVAVKNRVGLSLDEIMGLVDDALDELNVKKADGSCVWTRCCAHVDEKIRSYVEELAKNMWEEGFVDEEVIEEDEELVIDDDSGDEEDVMETDEVDIV